MNFAINIEQFRLIDGYDNYEISSHGRVRNNRTSRILKPSTRNDGYKQIGLNRDGERKHHLVHRLVAFAFLEKTDEQTEVDHIDHDKINNMVTNLRWTTHCHNMRNQSTSIVNTSGVSGVSFHKSNNIWEASWRDENMKRKYKSFSVNKYGNDEAKLMAINYRRERCLENGYINI